ncbi:trypsin-1 isoform X2 [Drosophila busckii]|nr:trypsin-1 isoform X2 [Drosophila busckii]
MEVRIIICHPRYSRQKHDVALLKLVGKLQIDNEFVGIMNITGKPPKAGLPCTTAGWGALFKDGPLPDIITNGDVQIQAMSKCRENEDARRLMSVGMICAGNPHNREIDACNGDSGGPLICENKLVGIVSWGVGCGRKDSYGFYTDVYYYKKFIDDNAATQAKVMQCWYYLLLVLLAICLL